MTEPRCCECNQPGELRPYGPGGAPICFDCAFASPEAEARTEGAYGALLDAHEALPGVTTLSVDGLGKIDLDDPAGLTGGTE